MPNDRDLTPAGKQQKLEDAYSTSREREIEDMRRRGELIGESERLEREAEKREAAQAARAILRKP